jgi:energy-coupling factor transporter ATP-binding protein EcfA2
MDWKERIAEGEIVPMEELPDLPSERIQNKIAHAGTPDQIQNLTLLIKAHKLAGGGSLEEEPSEKGLEYLKKLNTPSQEGTEEQIKARAMAFFRGGSRDNQRPEQITYELTRSILWRYYKAMVIEKDGYAPDKKLKMKDQAAATFKNFTHWLIGSRDGGWNPSKCLYLWGDLGCGKSTLIKAGRKVMAFYKREFQWSALSYDFISFAEVFTRVQTEQDLRDFSRTAKGNWALDELRAEHLAFKYYGNDLQLVQNLLTARYNGWEDRQERTIITSNIDPNNLASVFKNSAGEPDQILLHRMQQQYHFEELVNYNFRNPKHRL